MQRIETKTRQAHAVILSAECAARSAQNTIWSGKTRTRQRGISFARPPGDERETEISFAGQTTRGAGDDLAGDAIGARQRVLLLPRRLDILVIVLA